MAESSFSAQTITRTKTVAATQKLEITFEDSGGNQLVLSLPVGIATSALTPILHQLSASNPSSPGSPSFSRNVVKWAVGRSNEAPLVLLLVNDDPPLAFHVNDAKKMWREFRQETELVANRPTQTRQ